MDTRIGNCALLALCALGGCSNHDPDQTPMPISGTAGAIAPTLPAAGSMAQPPAPMTQAPGPMAQQPTPMTNMPGPMAQTPPAMPDDMMAPDQMPPDEMQEPEPAWEMLISADWELGPKEEGYFCQRVTPTEDIYLSAIRAVNPLGTHHTALTSTPGTPPQPDGLTKCNTALSPQGIFGSGVGTDDVFYPAGVGVRLRAGEQLLLNLHVFNVSDQPLSGTSGTAIVRTSQDKVEHVAESLLAGPVLLSIPPGGESTATGYCTMTHDITLFAVQPHMHQLGVHMKGVAESSARGEVLLHDGPYDFEHQVVYPIEPLEMKQGDVVRIECTFNNTTDRTVGVGESSNDEMCFLVLHRWPAPDDPSVTCFF